MTKKIEERFIGKWKGSDEGRVVPGQINFWIMDRKADGTFEIFFETHYDNGKIEQSYEDGIWYVIGDEFYEYRESDEKLDSYHFEFLSPRIIQFIDIDSDSETPYMFKDYKVIEN
nr:hypothetical protein [uncultured Flavobacterium sp.]